MMCGFECKDMDLWFTFTWVSFLDCFVPRNDAKRVNARSGCPARSGCGVGAFWIASFLAMTRSDDKDRSSWIASFLAMTRSDSQARSDAKQETTLSGVVSFVCREQPAGRGPCGALPCAPRPTAFSPSPVARDGTRVSFDAKNKRVGQIDHSDGRRSPCRNSPN